MENTKPSYCFKKGDIICFTDEISSRIIVRRGMEPMLKYYISGSVNGNEMIPIPLSLFKRIPYENAEQFLRYSKLNRQLYESQGNDELYELLAKKSVKVKSLVWGKAVDIDKTEETGELSLKKSAFPVYEIVEENS